MNNLEGTTRKQTSLHSFLLYRKASLNQTIYLANKFLQFVTHSKPSPTNVFNSRVIWATQPFSFALLAIEFGDYYFTTLRLRGPQIIAQEGAVDGQPDSLSTHNPIYVVVNTCSVILILAVERPVLKCEHGDEGFSLFLSPGSQVRSPRQWRVVKEILPS